MQKVTLWKVSTLQQKKFYLLKEIDIRDMDESQILRVYNQSQFLKKLNHPNIIKYKQMFRNNDKIQIITEYAIKNHQTYKNLGQMINMRQKHGQPFTPDQVVDYLIQLFLAMEKVHEKNIIHRHLSPESILVNKQNYLKISNFNQSKQLQQAQDLTQTILVSKYFLAPQIRQGKAHDQKSDIWSIGIIFYLLCSARPVSEINKENIDFSQMSIPNTYHSKLNDLYQQMMQQDPKKRLSVKEILKKPIITNKIKQIYLKNQNLSKKQKAELANKNKKQRTALKQAENYKQLQSQKQKRSRKLQMRSILQNKKILKLNEQETEKEEPLANKAVRQSQKIIKLPSFYKSNEQEEEEENFEHSILFSKGFTPCDAQQYLLAMTQMAESLIGFPNEDVFSEKQYKDIYGKDQQQKEETWLMKLKKDTNFILKVKQSRQKKPEDFVMLKQDYQFFITEFNELSKPEIMRLYSFGKAIHEYHEQLKNCHSSLNQ